MTQIAVLIGKDFEDSEYSGPAQAFKDAGYRLVHVGLKKGETVTGKKQATPVQIDMEADFANPDDFDALLIPGGYSPDNLRAHKGPVRFVKQFMERDKPVFAICHGPQLLISAGKLEGRKATGWKSLTCDIKYAGADFVDKEVVVDKNLVTSRQPSDIPAFIEASLKMLEAARAKAA
ncbi:MAG: type 1 glutamine amidotransferase [Syntrophobacteraceae bacterium]|nr:type 1 glutamine amidotransferase [Syntrophobacteraceae bacterium]